MPVHTTACPRNCYSTCAMRVRVDAGRLTAIEPSPANAATIGGACLKGLSYVERVTAPDRVLTPLLRRPGSSEFQPVTWDDALNHIAEQLVRIRDAEGPRSVLYYAGSGTKGLLNRVGMEFWKLYGGCTTTYGDLCWPAGLEATRLTLGANEHNAPWDLVHARLIVLWGKNPAETNLHQMPFIERAQAAGAKLVVIDPRRTESAERADLLLQPRPGTDGALALALAHLLIAKDQVDPRFIERHVAGYPEFAAMVRDFPPDRAAELTGLPLDSIHRLADLFGERRPATVCAGFGLQRYTNSGQALRAMIALTAITGNIGRPGAGWQFANLQSQIFDPVRDPLAFYPPEEDDGPVRVSVSTSRLGREVLETRDPALSMIWVERGNPVTQNPDSRTVLEAFRSLDFRVVVDQFLTDTAREADIVLPAKTMFEQSDVINAYWHPYVQFKRKLIEPPGQVKPESEIYRLLARRLGIPSDKIHAAIPGPSDAEVDAWLEARLEHLPGLSLDRLRREPVLAPNHREVAFSDGIFPTPSGKIELFSKEAARRWGVDSLPRFEESVESPRRDPALARRHPLQFMTPNTKNRIHSQFNNLPMIRAVSTAPELQVHPADARDRRVCDGESVRVFNDRGSLVVAARLDYGIRPGCVALTNGWWIQEAGGVNFLSLGRETDMGHGAAFHDNLVQVEKAP